MKVGGWRLEVGELEGWRVGGGEKIKKAASGMKRLQ